MYVYKKKCDEDYYISIIRSTQQQYMYQNPQYRPNFQNQSSTNPFYNNTYPGSMLYNSNNNSFTPNYNNNYNPFKTPENRNYNFSYNNNYYNNIPFNKNNNNLNERSPSPMMSRAEMKYGYHNNGNKKHALEDQILYNKLNHINDINTNHSNQNLKKNKNDEYKYIYNQNRNYNQNNGYINKKVFRLEDFLSESKKNNLNDKFNRAANEDFFK